LRNVKKIVSKENLILLTSTNPFFQFNKVLDLIAKGLFTEKYMTDSFAMFSPIVIEHSQTLLELLDALQKTRDSSMLYSFLATSYKLLFRNSQDSKLIIG
jgi:hypothetical protein